MAIPYYLQGIINMPSPISHFVVGLCYSSNSEKEVLRIFNRNILNYFLIMFVSVAPDLDIIPGFFAGMPSKFHHGISHSFFFAVVFGFILSSIIYLFKKNCFLSRAILFSALYSAHIILDLFTVDTGEVNGFGMPIFFPFSFSYYRSSIVLFYVGLTRYGFINPHIIFNNDNFLPFIIEILITLLIGISIIFIGRIFKKSFLL